MIPISNVIGKPYKRQAKSRHTISHLFFCTPLRNCFSLTKSGNWTGPHFRAEREINFEIVLHAVKLSSRAPRENSITFRPENGLQLQEVDLTIENGAPDSFLGVSSARTAFRASKAQRREGEGKTRRPRRMCAKDPFVASLERVNDDSLSCSAYTSTRLSNELRKKEKAYIHFISMKVDQLKKNNHNNLTT